MTVRLSEEQVDHIIRNYRGNGGRRTLYSLMKAHGITVNEAYTVLRTEPEEAIKKARRGHRFVSWEPGERYIPTYGEVRNSRQTQIFGNPTNIPKDSE
jgi:hypothetical protein